MANDEEHVDLILAATEGQPRKTAPPLAEWGTQNEQLAALCDKIDVLISVQIAKTGKIPPKMKPYARPETKFDEVREKRIMSRHKNTVSRVLGRPTTVE